MIDYDTADLDAIERTAYAKGDAEKSDMVQAIIELEMEIERLENELDDAKSDSLSKWEKEYGPAYDYYQFFNACFERLNAHYPCPEITSDYDKSVIFEAISKGDTE